jgi:NitT/TauT family transport system substrate-binding protein
MLSPLRALAAASAAVLAALPALAQEKTITLGWGAYADVPQYSVAADKGFFKDEGLTVKMIPFASGREGFEALIGGQLDLNIMAEFPAVVGAMRRQPFALLAVLSRYKANRIITTSAANAESAAGLAGRKVGVPVGTNTHFMLDEELKAAGAKAQVVNMTPPDLVPALLRGDVDAVVTFPGAYAGAKRTLGERYREIPSSTYATTYVLVAAKGFLDKDPDAAARFLRALVKAEAFMKAEPQAAQEAVGRAVKAIPLDAIKAAWGDYEARVGLGPDLVALMEREGAWIRERGMVKDVEPAAALFRGVIAEGPLKAAAPDRIALR